MLRQLINDEKFTNIQRAQSGLTSLFLQAQKTMSFFRVMKNDQPVGVLLPTNLWESLVEDIEALSSSNYRLRIIQARKSNKRYGASEVKQKLGLT